jgi:isopenicillin N synthase-like dioxygenase
LFALALDLPEDFFSDKVGGRNSYIVHVVQLTNTVPEQITKPAAIMRLLYYPPQTGVIDDRIIGIGAHTEYVNK